MKLKQTKIAKFKRDLEDYSNGTIYTWGKRYQRRKRTVSFNIPSTDEEEDDDRSTGENLGIHNKSYRKRRGKPEGAGGGEGRHFQRPATRSQSQNRQ